MKSHGFSLKGFFFSWVEPCLCIFSVNLRAQALTLEYLESIPPLENHIYISFLIEGNCPNFPAQECTDISSLQEALELDREEFKMQQMSEKQGQRDKNPLI